MHKYTPIKSSNCTIKDCMKPKILCKEKEGLIY